MRRPCERFNAASTPIHIVIPAHNEERSIAAVVRETRGVFRAASVIVISDGSADRTATEARSAGATVIDLPFNLGYGVALHTGLLKAYREGAQLVLTMDADGQHRASEAVEMVTAVALDEADIALGSRYLPQSRRCYRIPRSRRIGAWVFAQVLSVLTKTRITDPTTGFQCLGIRALRLYTRLPDFPEKSPDADLVLYAHRAGCRVKEMPVAMYEDESHDSMHGIVKSMFYVPKMLTAVLGMILIRNPE